jgi:transposase-like protein
MIKSNYQRRPFIMANKKRNVYKPKPMTEGKKNLIQGLLQEYEIESAQDIQDALKDLFSGTIQGMLESEMNEHLGYHKYERSGEPNYRNGTKKKSVRSKYGEFEVDVPQDRQSTFEPQIVPKRKKDISGIEDKIISMYAKGMTTTQISEMVEDIYGFEISEGMVSDITDKLLPQIEEWQNRPLSDVYPIIFIDAIHFSVRDDGIIRKLAAYVVLGINGDGYKEILTIEVGENESSKYWLSVLNSLKNRGVKDILILCSDGLTGLKESVQTAFPDTEHQRCIVHMVRNTLKYVANKDMKAFAKDLKAIYTAPDEKAARGKLEDITEKWEDQYPNAMNRWNENWDVITPIFKFSAEVRKAFYTTNAIESLNSSYRRLNRQRSVFPSSQALLKALYLATFEATKKWTMPIRNWGKVRGELSIMFPGRLSD